MVPRSVEVGMSVVEAVCVPKVYDGGPMDPWHIKHAPLDQTDIDEQCTSDVEQLSYIGDGLGHLFFAGTLMKNT